MTSPLSSFVTITFVNDGDAPTEVAGLAGTTFRFPPEYLAGLGSGAGNPGVIPGGAVGPVRGYLRPEAGGALSWVMTTEITAAQRTAILAIPGGLGWVDQSGAAGTPLRVVVNVGRALVQAGLAGPDVLDAMTKLVRAGQNNRNAQIVAGG